MKTQLEAIRAIDPKAAEYIETVVIPRWGEKEAARKVAGRQKLFWKKARKFHVMDLFFWPHSPQGRDYWFNIWKELNV